ncbi:MAG: hypothetical protein D6798_09265, partial [Deltaproteobacteria bacterium]
MPFPLRGFACAVLLLLVTACGAGNDLLGPPPPSKDDLPQLAAEQAQALGRVSCAACPDRWMPRPCDFLEELQRTPDTLDALTCAVVAPPASPPGVPESITPAVERLVTARAEALHDGGNHVDEALRLYAFGSDLQRLGTIELWLVGQRARAEALRYLAEAPPDDRWPRELMDLEAAAPAPSRIGNVAVLELLLNTRDPGWNARKALGRGAEAARAAIRARPEEQGDAMRQLRLALSTAWPDGQAPIDIVSVWDSAVAVRHRSIEVALTAAVSAQPTCPPSLDSLVPEPLP